MTFSSDSRSLRSFKSMQDVSVDSLAEMLSNAENTNKFLSAENLMLERYFNNTLPVGLPGSQDNTKFPGTQKEARTTSFASKRKSKNPSGDKTLLDMEFKFYVSLKERAEMKEAVVRCVRESEKCRLNYEALIEEASIRLHEIRQDSFDFERQIVKGSVDKMTHVVKAEKCFRYFDLALKAAELLRGKLAVERTTLVNNDKKLDMKIKQEEELGEVLDVIEYKQLKIMNDRYKSQLAERGSDLLHVKLQSAAVLQSLNSLKKKVQTYENEAKHAQKESQARKDLSRRLENDRNTLEVEISKAQKENKLLRKNLANYRVPSVMEYATEKELVHSLKQTNKIWERKINMAELALKMLKTTGHKLEQEGGTFSQRNSGACDRWPLTEDIQTD